MKIQFKIQDFQLQAVKAVVDCFQGQPLKSNKFTLERSKDIIKKAKQAAAGVQTLALESEVLEDIGYRNSNIQLVEAQVLKNIQIPNVAIKWPNDIYFNDSKAAGILIENSIYGNQWQWAVVGIGININQLDFGNDVPNAISLAQITQQQYDVLQLAKELCNYVEKRYQELQSLRFEKILKDYNDNLYKKNMQVKLKKDNVTFECIIDGVASNGDLMVTNGLQSTFTFGEVIWEIPKIK